MQPVDPSLARLGQARPAATAPGDAISLEPRLRLANLAVGQEVTARVLSDRAGGRFVALLQGRAVEIALPAGARAGDTVRLVVTADAPRLVLAAPAASGAAVPAGALASARQGGLPASPGDAAAAAAALPLARREVSVSAAGQSLRRLIADVAALAAGARGREGGAAAAAAPLVTPGAGAPAALAGQIAAALARTLSASGLFYESHQAQWVAGERSLEALKGEPQARLPPLAPGSRADAPAAAPPGPAVAGDPAAALRAAAAPSAREGNPALTGGSGALAGSVDPEAAPLVHQQIQALETRMAGWSGQVLPGMHAALVVHEREPQPGDGGAESAAGEWSTRLSVELPRLGKVELRLQLHGERLALSVAAGEAGTAAELHAARAALAGALAAAGLRLESLQFEAPAAGPTPSGPSAPGSATPGSRPPAATADGLQRAADRPA